MTDDRSLQARWPIAGTTFWAASRAACAAAMALAGCALFAPTAYAQDNQPITARTSLVAPLTITKLTDMDFGKIANPANAGTVVLAPTTSPTCTANGGLIQSGICQPATFGGSGQTNQRVRIRRPIGNTITLTGPGADMTITDIVFDADPDLVPVRSNPNWERYRISSSDGVFFVRVGGTLNVNAAQTPGIYDGTFTITLDYQ